MEIEEELEDALVEFILGLAYEVDCPYEEHGLGNSRGPRGGHGQIDYDWPQSPSQAENVVVDTLEHNGEPAIRVGAIIKGKSSKKTVSARRNPPSKAHPAEWEVIEHEVGIEIIWYPAGGGLDGSFEVTVEAL